MTVKAVATAFVYILLGLMIFILTPYITTTITWIPKELFQELTTSLFVAGLFVASIEIFNRTELINEVLRSLDLKLKELRDFTDEIRQSDFSKSLCNKITEEIFYQIDEFIIKSPYILRSMRVNLEFKPYNRKYFKLIDDTSFKVENLSQAPVHDEIVADEDCDLYNDYPEYPKVTHIKIGKEEVLDNLQTEKRIERTGDRLRINIPINIDPNEKIDISFTIEKIVRISDSDIWNVTYKTDCLSLVCSAPQNVYFEAYALHPDKNNFHQKSAGTDSTLKRWDMECGLLPFQGIRLKWRQVNNGHSKNRK
jgi:hypothetical protein